MLSRCLCARTALCTKRFHATIYHWNCYYRHLANGRYVIFAPSLLHRRHRPTSKCSRTFVPFRNGPSYLQTIIRNAHSSVPKKPEVIGGVLQSKVSVELADFPSEYIRNFCIIAHVDHGKSTLADRLLEVTGTISASEANEQVLDKLPVEKERGITVKAQAAALFYDYKGHTYLLNLVDTPGHVDFAYEVSRSLSTCQGVVLLVDANQGVQAQTLANFYIAFVGDKTIIPVLNKIDLKNANPEAVTAQLTSLFEISPESVLKTSAKVGTGVEELLQAIIERVPPPSGDISKPLRALIFDSWFEQYRGALAFISVVDGSVKIGDEISSIHNQKTYTVKELGIMHPNEVAVPALYSGQVGYLAANMKTTQEAQVGDTIFHKGMKVEALPSFSASKPMVFAGIYALEQSQTTALRGSLEKLTLNDSSVSVTVDRSPALGQGWRVGFLGLLHMDVFIQRLEQEYGAQVVVTVPSVPYKVKISGEKNIKEYGGEVVTISNPLQFPEKPIAAEYEEPIVLGTIITPDVYLGDLTSLCMDRRGRQKDCKYIDSKNLMLQFILPLNEIIIDFFDDLKRISSGYASFDYEDYGYESSNLVKLNVLLNGKIIEELTSIVHSTKARKIGHHLCAKLKEMIHQHQFVIAIQATVGGKVVARENIKAYRKDVTAKLYGGDVTRRKKLLVQQREGKKKMRMIGNIEVPRDTFIKVLKR